MKAEIVGEEELKPRVLGLFKFGQREHIDKLVHEGHVYINPLSYYIRLEASDGARADKYEATSFWMQPDRAKLQIELDGEYKDIPGLIGPITYREEAEARVNVYCMYAVQHHDRPDLIDTGNLRFGDTYAVFAKPDEFLLRLRAAAESQGHEVAWGLVRYIDGATYHGPGGIFAKDNRFAYQSEFRIALRPGTGEPLLLELGDLSGLILTGELASINSHFRIIRR